MIYLKMKYYLATENAVVSMYLLMKRLLYKFLNVEKTRNIWGKN